MADQAPVNFFDIESTLSGTSRSWSPNTLKTRMVLNYKGIPYTQSFISYPDIAPLLSHMGVSPHPEGARIPYTLPAICHPSVTSNPSGALMDSLPIATHLEAAFPSSPTIFPSGDASYGLAIAVDKLAMNATRKVYTIVAPRVAEFMDPRGKEYVIRTRSVWFGKPLLEVLPTDPEEIQKLIGEMKQEIIPLVQMLKGGIGKSGPFFEGEKPSYADFILVGFIAWFERADKEIFQEFMNLGNGEFKALWDSCLPWLNGQGENKDWEIRH